MAKGSKTERDGEGDEPEELREALARLYDASPEEFTSLRKRIAGDLKSAGKPELAKRVATARRPNRVAATINRIVLRDPGAVRTVFEAFDEAAGEQVQGNVLAWKRALASYRERLAALNHAVRAAVAESGGVADAALLRGISEAVQTAAIDPDARTRLLLGRMEKAVDAADPLAGLGAPPPHAKAREREAPREPPKAAQNKPDPLPEKHAKHTEDAHGTKRAKEAAATEVAAKEAAAKEAAEREKHKKQAARVEQARLAREKATRDRAIAHQRAQVEKVEATLSQAERLLVRARLEAQRAEAAVEAARANVDAANAALRALARD